MGGCEGVGSNKLLQRRAVSLLNVCQLRCARRFASTLLARHNVEKIKTVRPLNTSLNPLQGSRRARAVRVRERARVCEGGGGRRLRGCGLCAHGDKKSFDCLNQGSRINYGPQLSMATIQNSMERILFVS